MDRLVIEGGKKLSGRVVVAGAKNAALPLMAACLLTDKPVKLSNIPHLSDITTMANLLVHLGVELSLESFKEREEFHSGRVLVFSANTVKATKAPYDIVRRMRASVIVLGPLLARFGEAEISLPGGCAIGARPINYHLSALEKMGTEIILEDGYVKAKTINARLKGAVIDFPTVSVGATENILLAATLAEGTTILNNAACEPEVTDLANMLNKMGAKIKGIGTHRLEIEGVTELNGVSHNVVADRIEAGTYLAAAGITGGDVEVVGIDPTILGSTLKVFEDMGMKITTTANSVRAIGNGLNAVNVVTAPYPDFPTDMQAQITALMCIAKGTSVMQETIFENRFMHVPELMRMGTKMEIESNKLKIEGIDNFKPAEVMATDLRASVSLVLAALRAEGKSIISRVYHLDRGYERIEEKLRSLGAEIYRIGG